MKPRLSVAMLACFMGIALQGLGQRTPTTQPRLIAATDKAALESAIGEEVTVHGTILAAAWSRSGAVMNIEFVGTEESRFLAVVFERSKTTVDTSFSGDLAKALNGAKVRLRGKLERYGGHQESFRNRPQMILNRPDQITVVEPTKL